MRFLGKKVLLAQLVLMVLLMVLLSGTPLASAVSGDDAAPEAGDGGEDTAAVITDSAVGTEAIADFEERLPEETAGVEYEVYTEVPGDDPEAIWVLPADQEMPTVLVEENGVFEAETHDAPPVDEVEASEEAAQPAAVRDAGAEFILASVASVAEEGDGSTGPEVIIPDTEVPGDGPEPSIEDGSGTSTGPGAGGYGGGGGGGGGGATTDGGSPYYKVYTPTCYSRYTSTMGWMDHCMKWGKMMNDGDSSRDHWTYYRYGTCKSKNGTKITRCHIRSERDKSIKSSPGMVWEDWAPRTDSEGGCRTKSVGISVAGVSATGYYEACEKQDITKYSEAGKFENAWAYPAGRADAEREVAYQVAFNVPNGTYPKMVSRWGVAGFLNNCC